MFRLLAATVALIALMMLPGQSVAGSRRAEVPFAGVDLGARRCVCEVRRARHVRVVQRFGRRVAVRLPLRIGYEPVPYRFGYTFPAYRYIHRYAVVRTPRAIVYR
jgi:hypothetical protein